MAITAQATARVSTEGWYVWQDEEQGATNTRKRTGAVTDRARKQRGGNWRRRRSPRGEGTAKRDVPGKEWRRRGLGSAREARTEPTCLVLKTTLRYENDQYDRRFVLRGVLWVPQLHSNLISCSKLGERGYSINIE